MIAEGVVLNKRYHLDRRIGRGGFATVYLGTDLLLQRRVAVKVLVADLIQSADGHDFLARFEREAQAVAALDHPNILAIFDYGRLQDNPYLVMPYIDGGSLADTLRTERRLGLARTRAYLRQLASALDYAHRRGIVHRDIKPQNILIRAEDERLFLADFGIAKVLSGTSGQTQTGVMGTISYMAPEQFEGTVSPATDIYALGCMLFQMLTGEVPYSGDLQQTMFNHVMGPIPSVVGRSQGQVPPSLQAVIDRALAKRPQDRFASAGELVRDFEALATGDLPAAPPVTFATGDPRGAATPAWPVTPPNGGASAASVAFPPAVGTPPHDQGPATGSQLDDLPTVIGGPAATPPWRLSRRQLIVGGAALGLAATVGTAGAAVAARRSGDGATIGREFHGTTTLSLPPTGHSNWWLAGAFGSDFWGALEHLPPAWYRWHDDRYVPALAERWGFSGGDIFSFTLRSGLKWSNGRPLTSRDVLATWLLNRLAFNQLFDYVDEVKAVDERTITFHMNRPATAVQHFVLRQRVRPASIFGEWADKAAALYAAGKSNMGGEVEALRNAFLQFRPAQRLSSGPYILDPQSQTAASVDLVRNPKGVNGGVVRFNRIKLYAGETPITTPLVLARKVDFSTNGFSIATDKAMQEQGIRVLRTPDHGGPSVNFNFAHPRLKVFGDRRARQALAHAVNRDDNAVVAIGESGKPVRYMAGFSDTLVPRWLTQADIGRLNRYPYDPQRAASLLLEAGCRKGADGQWADPDGQRMEYDVLCAAEFLDHIASAQHFAESLTRFGIKVTMRAMPFAQAYAEQHGGRFELAYDFWGTGNPYPVFSFVSTLLSKVPPLSSGPYTSFELRQRTAVAGDVDFRELIAASGAGLDPNVHRANITKAALAYNEVLPNIPLFERYSNGPALEGTRVTGWPPDGDPLYENTLHDDAYVVLLIFDGRLGPAPS